MITTSSPASTTSSTSTGSCSSSLSMHPRHRCLWSERLFISAEAAQKRPWEDVGCSQEVSRTESMTQRPSRGSDAPPPSPGRPRVLTAVSVSSSLGPARPRTNLLAVGRSTYEYTSFPAPGSGNLNRKDWLVARPSSVPLGGVPVTGDCPSRRRLGLLTGVDECYRRNRVSDFGTSGSHGKGRRTCLKTGQILVHPPLSLTRPSLPSLDLPSTVGGVGGGGLCLDTSEARTFDRRTDVAETEAPIDIRRLLQTHIGGLNMTGPGVPVTLWGSRPQKHQ